MKVLRALDGISYWVLEDPVEIRELVNVSIRKEWESDDRHMGKDPKENQWLRSLASRSWRLETSPMEAVKLNQEIMSFKDDKTGYDFSESLQKRKTKLKREMEEYGAIIRPVILRGEDMQLMDGYCRFTTLSEMRVPRVLAYVGTEVVP